MTSDQDLTLFIKDNVRSVWALEMLLMLRRDPARRWSVDELVAELRASASLVSNNLAIFERNGLVMREDSDRFGYAPASPLLDGLCADLEAAYRAKPVATINLIVRSAADAVQSLADAFKFRGDGE